MKTGDPLEPRCEKSDLLESQCEHCREESGNARGLTMGEKTGQIDGARAEEENMPDPRGKSGAASKGSRMKFVQPEEAFRRGRFGKGRPGYENR